MFSNNVLIESILASAIIMIVTLILAIVGGIVVVAVFLPKKNEYKFSGFLGQLYDFLNFKTFFAEILLRTLYIISAAWLSLSALGNLFFVDYGSFGTALLVFILTIVFGNLIIRLVFEFSMVKLVVCRNTSEMNRKLGKLPEQEQQTPGQFQQNFTQQNYTQQPAQPAQPEVDYCPNCGQAMAKGSAFCPRCGAVHK